MKCDNCGDKRYPEGLPAGFDVHVGVGRIVLCPACHLDLQEMAYTVLKGEIPKDVEP